LVHAQSDFQNKPETRQDPYRYGIRKKKEEKRARDEVPTPNGHGDASPSRFKETHERGVKMCQGYGTDSRPL